MKLKVCFLGAVRRRTFICCRNVRISASSAAHDRNRSTTIQTMGLTRSLIPQQHRPILDQLVRLSLRQGQVDGDNYTCGQVEALAIEHVQDIRRKIADLKKLKAALETIASQCCAAKTPKCPIDALFDVRAPIRPAKPARDPCPV